MKIITSYLIQAAIWLMVYLWLSYGLEGAHSLLVAYLWICAIVTPLAFVGWLTIKPESKSAKEIHHQWANHKIHSVFQRVVTTVFYLTMIWNGHEILATVCVLFWVLVMYAAHNVIDQVEAHVST